MTEDRDIYAVVLAGGRGERFWPKSRAARPKQLQALAGEGTMIEQTLERVAPLAPLERRWIITSAELSDAVAQTVGPGPRIIGEPVGRNTAPAIALAAAEIARDNPQALMLVLPSDHYIRDVDRFRQTLLSACRLAAQGFLTTIGIQPTRPETGYGYIEKGRALGGQGCFAVQSFREKPDRETAEGFIKSGRFFWNGGIFVWTVNDILENIKRHLPDLYEKTRAWQARGGLTAGPEEFRGYFESVDKISIDYGVMEKAERVAMVIGDFGWDDLGSWEAVAAYLDQDDEGNRYQGQVVALESKDNIVVTDQGLVALLGVEDLIVVRSGNAVLVCRRDRAQEVRRVVEELGRTGGNEYL